VLVLVGFSKDFNLTLFRFFAPAEDNGRLSTECKDHKIKWRQEFLTVL